MKLIDEMELQFSKDLLEKRIIHLTGKITPTQADRIIFSLAWLNARSSEEITLYIKSDGGEVLPGLQIYDSIRLSVAPVIGVVLGEANSMASVVLQACRTRKAVRHACLIMHYINVTRSLSELIDEQKRHDSLAKSWEYQNSIFCILVERSGMSIEPVEKLCRESRVLGAEEAKKLNLIDEII